jgi:hypothetical protein
MISQASALSPIVKTANLLALEEYVEQSWDFDDIQKFDHFNCHKYHLCKKEQDQLL